MVTIGDTLTLTVHGLARSGAGVAFYEAETKRAVFIPQTAPGDTIRARITKQRKAYYEAELLELLTPSPKRIPPPCDHVGACGACDWLHVAYVEQLAQKERLLRHAFAKRKIPLGTVRIVAGEAYGYRCKVRFPGNGFSARRSNMIVPVTQCRLLHAAFQPLLPERHVKDECWGLDEPTGTITKEAARYRVAGALLTYDPTGFVQSNFGLNRLLVDHLLAIVAETGSRRILELYAGNGNFTIPLAQAPGVTDLVAVEGEASGHRLLAQNLAANGVTARIFHEDVHRFVERTRGRFDAVLLDPPRTGVGPAMARIGRLADTLIYVSCDADALARDLSTLEGFRIADAVLFDLFPQTRHFETVLLLRREPAT